MSKPKIHVSWSDEDYRRARDMMIEILRHKCWSISDKQGVQEFDDAFQHAVGMLALKAETIG